MFEDLVQYDHILVTGPQRSGTTIAAKMIAADTDYRYVDESEYDVHLEEAFADLLAQEHHIVVQCPSMSHIVHQVVNEHTLVVMMMRDCDDIAASEERVGWTVGPYPELYTFGMSPRQAVSFRRRGGQVAPLKYARWKEQREQVPHYLELAYESLAAHPLWVPKERRVDFAPRQTVP
jgi:hypothetical protein